MSLVVAAGSWYAVAAFPLTQAAQEAQTEIGPLEKQAKPITPENPIPRRTYSIDPVYPAEAAAAEANAMITLMITLDQFGRVAEIRRLGVAASGKHAGKCGTTGSPDIHRRVRCARQVRRGRGPSMDVRPASRTAAVDSGDVCVPVQREAPPGHARRLVDGVAGSVGRVWSRWRTWQHCAAWGCTAWRSTSTSTSTATAAASTFRT